MFMRWRGILVFIGGLSAAVAGLIAALTGHEKITRVMVWHLDPDPQVLRTLASAEELEAFTELWSTRVTLGNVPKPDASYRFYIGRERRGDSWYYNPEGFVWMLTIQRKPLYRLPSPEAFNTLLGIERGSP
jgi:hypothetical protein